MHFKDFQDKKKPQNTMRLQGGGSLFHNNFQLCSEHSFIFYFHTTPLHVIEPSRWEIVITAQRFTTKGSELLSLVSTSYFLSKWAKKFQLSW